MHTNRIDRDQRPGQAASSPAVRRASAQPGTLIRVGEGTMTQTSKASAECYTCVEEYGPRLLTAYQEASHFDCVESAHRAAGHDVRSPYDPHTPEVDPRCDLLHSVIEEVCHECAGTGGNDGMPCDNCNGTGRKAVPR